MKGLAAPLLCWGCCMKAPTTSCCLTAQNKSGNRVSHEQLWWLCQSNSQALHHVHTLHTIHTPLTQCEANVLCERPQVQGLPCGCQASSHPQLHWHAHCAGQWVQSGGTVCAGYQASRHGCLLHETHGECGWFGGQGDRGPGRR